jgi:hypothetical protein
LYISCDVVPGISDHNGVLLEVEWDEHRHGAQVERVVPLCHKTDALGLQAFLREKFKLWAGRSSRVEEIWISFKDIILFRADFTTFRRDRAARGGGVFIFVKNPTACKELWVDEDYDMIAVEEKGIYPKHTWEIIGIYRAPNEDMSAIKKLAACTVLSRSLTKSSIVGGDLNRPQAVWVGDTEKTYGGQAFINSLVWENGYTQVVSGPTRGYMILDIYLIRPESLYISCDVVPGISDHNGVLLEVEWDEHRNGSQALRVVPLYHKTDVLGLQAFLREKFKLRAGSGSSVEEIWIS